MTQDGKPRTMFEKVWNAHIVREQSDDTPAVLYIDLHLVHEVTSPQAFTMLRERGTDCAPTRSDDWNDGPQYTNHAEECVGNHSGCRCDGGEATRYFLEKLQRLWHPYVCLGR